MVAGFRAVLAALPIGVAFAEGAAVPIDGVPHPIRHEPGGRGGAWIEDGAILVSGEEQASSAVG